MGAVHSHMDSVCVCMCVCMYVCVHVCVCVMYVMDNSKRQEEAMSTGRQSPSSSRRVSWFISHADGQTGQTA